MQWAIVNFGQFYIKITEVAQGCRYGVKRFQRSVFKVLVHTRVDRYVVHFHTTLSFWVNFGGPLNGKCCYTLMTIWNILR
jgi:hypothetical protein